MTPATDTKHAPDIAPASTEGAQGRHLTTDVVEPTRLVSRLEDMAVQVRAIFDRIPDAGEDGEVSIAVQILSAASPDQLDAPWTSAGLGQYVGKRIRIDGVRKMVSAYDSGFGWFFVLDVTDLETGEKLAVTTGAVSVMAQIVRAVALDALPLTVIPRVAQRPSRNGFYPQHLEIVR